MSDQGSESDRSEQATPHKLSKAREKGSVARGADLGFLTGLTAFAIWLWFLGAGVAAQLGGLARAALVSAGRTPDSPHALLEITGALMAQAGRPVLLMAGTILLVVLVFELIQTGGVFSTQALAIDFSRLNPATGLKRVFSVRMLIETGKNIAKLAVYSVLAFLAVRAALTALGPEITDAHSLADGLRRAGGRMLSMFLAAALGFAILDQLISRRDFAKKMRMSRRDVRRESRDREGEPRLKQKRKQLHREFVQASESLRNIRGADVLITNPTHYAVALRYDARTMEAPVVVSRGAHRFALRLRRLAFLYGVVIVEEPPLARALYRCEIQQPVPEACYGPVAAILRRLREAKRTRSGGEGV